MKKPFPISALSFVYNEAHCIEEPLQQLRPYMEKIIIIDQCSTDGTMEIAKKYADIVAPFPHLLCGDGYKTMLMNFNKSPWVLWWYPDERWPQKTLEMMAYLIQQDQFDCAKFQRREYMDGIDIAERYLPNYQNRLHRVRMDIFYTDLVHAEVHGTHRDYAVPGEYFMEHKKSSADQEFDNIRLYIDYERLLFQYGETPCRAYKELLDSYKEIIAKSEAKNLTGERKIHLSECFWWDWRKYINEDRMTLEQFKERVGMEYGEFLKRKQFVECQVIDVKRNVRDEVFKNG